MRFMHDGIVYEAVPGRCSTDCDLDKIPSPEDPSVSACGDFNGCPVGNFRNHVPKKSVDQTSPVDTTPKMYSPSKDEADLDELKEEATLTLKHNVTDNYERDEASDDIEE